MRPFHGLSAFPLTPADERGRVDTGALGRLLERLCLAGVDSIGLLGSTGIYAYLTREERRRALEAAVERVAGRIPLIVGVGALRTDAACDLARDAAEAAPTRCCWRRCPTRRSPRMKPSRISVR